MAGGAFTQTSRQLRMQPMLARQAATVRRKKERMLPKIAVLDLGSNSFHLAIAEGVSSRRFALIAHAKEKVQLGRSVFTHGRVDADAFARGLSALKRLRTLCDSEGSLRAVGVATSALREASNGAAFVQAAAALTGIPIRTISGEEEARLVCRGTLHGLAHERPLRGERIAIFDLGGGSTEVIVADAHTRALTCSLALGTLRMRDALRDAGPARPDALARLEHQATTALDATLARVRVLRPASVVLSCGSARKLVRVARRLGIDDCGSEPAPQLTHATLLELRARLAALSAKDRASLAGSDPTRADTLLVATTIFKPIFERLAVERVRVSLSGLREGVISEQLAQHEAAADAYAVAL